MYKNKKEFSTDVKIRLKKILVIGGGLSGCIMTRLLLDEGHEVTIAEKNDKLGGMCEDYYDEDVEFNINKYGAHIWHFDENSFKYFDWLSKYGDFREYEHKVMCLGNGNFTYWPINHSYDTIYKFLGGENVSDEFIESYSKKMWGDYFPLLFNSIKKRFEPKSSFNNKFFGNEKQYILYSGFTNLCNKLVAGAKIHTNTEINLDRKKFENYDLIILTGNLDNFYYENYGKLQYRGIEFISKKIICENNILPTSVLNLNTNKKYLRVVEYNQFYNNNSKIRVLVKEKPSSKTKFYPVLTETQKKKYKQYLDIHEKHNGDGKIKLLGRLAKYKYLDMDEVLVECFELKKELKDEKKI